MKTKLIVSTGQYETAAEEITVDHKSWRGLRRRISQLQKDHATFGDNFAGWIPARVALASDQDAWGNNNIIGGRWCCPVCGWLVKEQTDYNQMSYSELEKIIEERLAKYV